MRIAILAPSVYMSATTYPDRIFAPREVTLTLTEGLVSKGHDVTLFSSPDITTKAKLIGGDSKLLKSDLLRDKYLNRELLPEYVLQSRIESQQMYSLDLASKAYSLSEISKFEILHTDDPIAHSFASVVSTPSVFVFHDPLPRENSLDFWFLDRYKNHNFISLSMAQRIGKPKMNFIGNVYHGVKIEEYKAFYDKGEYFAYMGRLLVQKGIDKAIEAAKRLNENLLIAADKTHFQTNFVTTKVLPILTDKIRYAGYYQGTKEKNEFVGKAKALIFPILWNEPFGLVMIEAMASGTPVIAFSNGSVAEVIKDGVTGFIVNPSDEEINGNFIIKKTGVEGLTEAMTKINELSSEKLIAMRKNSRKHVEENFSVEKMVDGYENAYKEVLKNRRK